MVVMEGMCRHREASVEEKQNYEGSVSVRCSSKRVNIFTPEEYLGRVLHVRVFWLYRQAPVYMCGGAVWAATSCYSFGGGPVICVCESLARVREGER